jgi:hypothetical protein
MRTEDVLKLCFNLSRCAYFGPWRRNARPSDHDVYTRPSSLDGCGGVLDQQCNVISGQSRAAVAWQSIGSMNVTAFSGSDISFRFCRRLAKRQFERQNPCPSTGKTTGRCPGYVVDHRRALAEGGADEPSNMQWQSTADAKAKDKWERKP